jgi:hypothetical protein
MCTCGIRKSAISRRGVWLGCASLLLPARAASAQTELEKYQTDERLAAEHIAKYRTADFDVFTNQRWDRIQESHAKDVVVHWPDGRRTDGIEAHIADLKGMFAYAPDTRIHEHRVEIATAGWSSIRRARSRSRCPRLTAKRSHPRERLSRWSSRPWIIGTTG